MQPVPVKSGLVARQDPYRFAAKRRLLAPLRKPHRQCRHVASRNRIAAQLLRAGQYYSEHPLRLAQFKSNVNGGIIHRGGCVSVIETRHLGPPRLDGCRNSNPNLLTTRRPIGSEEHRKAMRLEGRGRGPSFETPARAGSSEPDLRMRSVTASL